MNDFAPKIKVKDALEQVGGNQAKLARALGYGRAYVNEVVNSGREFLPAQMALRYFFWEQKQ